MERLVSRPRIAGNQLLDLQLGALEASDALLVELLAAAEERDRLVHGHVATLDARNDLLELALKLLETPRAHSCTSSTRAAREPDASWMSSAAPVVTSAAARPAPPPARTIA